MGIDSSNQWIKGAVWALAGTLSGLIVLGGAIYSSDRATLLERIELAEHATELLSSRTQDEMRIKRQRVNAIEKQLSSVLSRTEQHRIESEYWKNVIDANRSSVSSIANDARARKDPFTGTMGREHERRIDANEKCCIEMRSHIKKCKHVDKENQ